jgi:hypothetical protein
MLLALHLLALGVGTIIFWGMIILHRRARELQRKVSPDTNTCLPGRALAQRPAVWLAIHSIDSKAVLPALEFSYPVSRSRQDALATQRELFINPPLDGWIIVTGSRLPRPGDDVDACFHFLVRLSRELGQVQLFMADAVKRHHAWVRAENGRITRAYAWANETIWNQGPRTLAEIELSMKCFDYGEGAEAEGWPKEERAGANVAKVPALAARWGFYPAALEHNGGIPADGITGKSSRLHQD